MERSYVTWMSWGSTRQPTSSIIYAGWGPWKRGAHPSEEPLLNSTLDPTALGILENLTDFRLLEVDGHKQNGIHRVIIISKQLKALGVLIPEPTDQADIINPKNRH